MVPHGRKVAEIALSLHAIEEAAVRETSIRRDHPSPLPSCSSNDDAPGECHDETEQ